MVRKKGNLRRHVEFFGNDKIIIPEIYDGFRRLGFSILESVIAAPIIGVSTAQQTGACPFSFAIRTKNIDNAMHPQFHLGGFEKRLKLGKKDRYTIADIFIKIANNSKNPSPFSVITSISEWSALFLLMNRVNGGLFITKRQIKSLYNGDLFYDIANKRKHKALRD